MAFLLFITHNFAFSREANIAEKKAAYQKIIGEKFPEKVGKDSTTVKSEKTKIKVTSNEPTRKSPRMVPAVNYKEQLPVFENKIPRPKADISDGWLISESNHRKCGMCDKVLATVFELKSHIEKKHTRVLFNCPICEQPMYSKANLKKHYVESHK